MDKIPRKLNCIEIALITRSLGEEFSKPRKSNLGLEIAILWKMFTPESRKWWQSTAFFRIHFLLLFKVTDPAADFFFLFC